MALRNTANPRHGIQLSERTSCQDIKDALKTQLRADERGWPGTISKESLALVDQLITKSPAATDSARNAERWSGEYNVLSFDPLTVALEYNEANVVRGGALARVTSDGEVEMRIEIKWRSDEILPVELNGTVSVVGDAAFAVSLVDGAVRSPTSGEIQDMMDAQGTLRGSSGDAFGIV